MFRLLGLLIKASLFAIIVLVLGNWLHWGDRTISDEIKVRMSHAERSDLAGKVKDFAGDVSRGLRNSASGGSDDRPIQGGDKSLSASELIPSSERQKLKALIRELNSSFRN
ncbi:MAG: hypothetical protein NDJ90_14165 [Oligoflexia bacterium]|nr:hypothetical protein [Oligoflexia bacterium]